MTLGQKLKRLRKEKSISQAQLAAIINIAQTHIGRYERDASIPTAYFLKRIADFYNVTVDYLLSDEEAEAPNVTIIDKELLKKFEEVCRLGDTDKNHIKYFLNLVINNSKIKQITA
jgi:transcriptional regulator with XRE-family HTH domain